MQSPIDRRTFLAAAGAAFCSALPISARDAVAETELLFASACKTKNGAFGIGVFSSSGRLLHLMPLGARGHDLTVNPVNGHCVAFARRPGTFAVIFDPANAANSKTIASPPGRHFYGHGTFSADGRILYATENDFENARGVVGLYDASDGYRRLAEFESGGIGPHDILLMPDGKTLAVANGGIETHPDFGRAKLNLATMEPSLVFVHGETGDILERHVLPPPQHQLSIRHLAVDQTGHVWFGCQYEGNETDFPPLVGIARPGDPVTLLKPEPKAHQGLQNYIGSVTANRDGSMIATSGPRGDRIAIWNAGSRSITRTIQLTEGSGVAANGAGFVATSGVGGAGIVGPDGLNRIGLPDLYWDNHAVALGPITRR